MLHNSHQLQFFMSTDSPCPYLQEERERKLFTSLASPQAEAVQNALSKEGFRRSQNIVYRPVCQNCAACLSARIPVKEFAPSKNQKRVFRRNQDVVRELRPARATDEQYELFERYVRARHFDGGMSDMSLFDYAAMIEETNVPTKLVEYRLLENGRPEQLVAVSLCDVLDNGLSMVYSFFDPDMAKRSLGAFMILDHLELCANIELPYLYLGYWVKGSHNMDYKSRYRPLELYHKGLWRRYHDLPDEDLQTEPQSSQKVLFQALKTLSRLPK